MNVREGYFNAESFLQWVEHHLLPLCNTWPAPRSVIILDNASAHCNPQVEEVIREAACEVKYLPPCLPEMNPIDRSFSVLKGWVRQHFHSLWHTFQDSFGDFLRYAVIRSRCDRFAVDTFDIVMVAISSKQIFGSTRQGFQGMKLVFNST